MKRKKQAPGRERSDTIPMPGKRITSRSPGFQSLSSSRRTLILLWESRFLLIMICVIMAVVLSYNNYKDSQLHASATLAFNYQESSNGLYPNKTRLNLSEFKSDEVLENAIALAGLTGTLDADTLSQAITINPSQVKYVGTSTENFYVATSYYVYLDMPAEIPRLTCADLLSLVCMSYSDYFHSHYTENRAILSVEVPDYQDEEYYVTSDLLESQANRLLRYVNMRISSASNYSNNESITEYKNLVQQLYNFVNYDLHKYRTFIMQTGLARDTTAYQGVLTYDNMEKQYEYDRLMDAYNANKNGLEMYDVIMSATVLIPTLRSDNKYYMSRTNSQMDYFTTAADEYLASASAVNEEIMLNDRLLAALSQTHASRLNIGVADGLIDSMYKTLGELSDSINQVDEKYVLNKTRDYLKISRHYTSVLDVIGYKKVAIICLAFLLLVAVAVFNVQSSAKWKAPLTYSGGKKAGDA